MSDYRGPGWQPWPMAEFVGRAWLVPNLPGVNVRTETNATFGTPIADDTMTLPLVLLEGAPGGYIDADSGTQYDLLDVTCFGATRLDAWDLYKQVHPLMIRLRGQSTTFGTIDDVTVDNGAGIVSYKNPNLRRVITTYRLASRAQAL